MATVYKVFLDENGQISAKSRMYAVSENGRPIESISVSGDDSNWGAPVGDKILKMRPVQEEQFKAFDPQTGNIVDVRSGDQSVRMARMRHALDMNPYKALSSGLFAGEIKKDDPNDNVVFNLVREIGRAPSEMIATLPQHTGALGSSLINGDKITKNPETGEWETHADRLLKSASSTKASIDKAFGENRGGVASDLGGGIGTAAAAIGAAWLTGGTAAPAVMFGIDAGGNALDEGRKAGLDPIEARNRALGVGVSNGVLESFGLGLIWKSAGNTLATRAIKGFLVEGSEEILQGVSEDLIMRKVRGKSIGDILSDALYQGVIGGVVGAGMGAVAGGNIEGIKKGLMERGLTESQADALIAKTVETASNTQIREAALKAAVEEQKETAEFIRENQDQIQPVLQSVINDALDAGRRDVDIRDDIKSRAQGLDETTQNIVADSVQNFADVMADDFGITQREFIESTGLQVQTENGTQIKFADGTQIDENGNLLDKDGKVLFQRVGKKGANERELDALLQALEMEKAGYDNDTIKNSTGWSRGLDNQMWMETNGKYSINLDGVAKLVKSESKKAPLRDIINTDNFERYPQFQNTEIQFVYQPKTKERAHWDRKNNRIQINVPNILNSGTKAEVQIVKTIAHEMDHAIADIEGFENGSKVSEKALEKQVARHEQRMIDTLRELGLYEKYAANLEKQGKKKSHYDAVQDAILDTYTAEDLIADPELNKKLDVLRADAIIVDRYGKETLKALNEKEREARINEAYKQTIGERYARRAGEIAVSGRSDAQLRATPDETETEMGSALLSPNGTTIDARIGEIVRDELAADLNPQRLYQGDDDVRGYFDYTNKMQQIIQIMKSGDLDTVLHELGHFFSVNYINMAIETGHTEKIQPLLEYYKVEDPARLIADDSIQEDLAVKFLSYLKTDQTPRGFRKYFDMAKNWLIQMWESLKSKGLVQDKELPDEIVRFFDDITIRRPRNLNINNAMNEKVRLKKILHAARTGALDGVSDSDIHTIEELLKTATARIPRMPKSLYTKLWGQLNTQFAETHDLLPLMGIDEKAKYLATSKNGGIKNEQDLLDWLQEEGFIFGDGWENNAAQDMMRWDDALRLLGNAKNTYSVDDMVRVQEIDNLRQAQDVARDILDGRDSYDAMADIDNAKSAIQRVNDAIDRSNTMNKALASDYKKLQAEVRMAKAGTSEMRKAVKAAVSFLYAQDIPTDIKAKFMRTIPMVHDSRSLAKWIGDVRERAEKEYSDLAFRGQRDRLKHELQETYSANKRNIKYDYEHNKLFNDLRQYNLMSAEKAQEEIKKFYDGDQEKDGLSREDELRKMMLEYRANLPRKQMSGAFMDELISRIQEAKLIGRDAIDEIQFTRGMERVELRDEILDAIAKNKATKIGKHFAGIADFKSLLTMITNGNIADRFNMVVREVQAGIAAAGRQGESMREVLRINGLPVANNTRKDSYQFLKYKAELCQPIEELNVFYTDHHGRKVQVGIDNGKKTFSKAHIMDMWNQYKDPKSRELMDKFYGQWQMDQLFSYLTDQDKQTADYLMERLRDIYDMVNPVYVSLYQKDMPHKKIYWPRQSNHEVDHELLERFDGEAREANFTKSRSHGAIPVFKRDVFSNYQAHEKDAQYMVYQAKAFKDAADIFDESTVKEAIVNKFGKDVAAELSEHLKALSIGGVRKARSSGDAVINQVFGQIVGSKVNLSPFVMMKQLTSFGAFSANMPVGRFYKDFAAGIAQPRKTYKYMMEHAGDYLKNRYGRGTNETMAAMIDPANPHIMDRLLGAENRASMNEFLSRLVRTGDIGAIIYGGYPRLKFLIEETDATGKPVRTHEQAVEQFIKESEETQQSATNASQSNWQRAGKTKVFAMYKTSQIQYFRKVANAYNMMKRGEITRGQFNKTVAIFSAQMAICYKLMGDLLSAALYGWDDDKDAVDELGELAGAVITQGLDAWGALGYLSNQAFSAFTGQKRQADLSIVGISDVLQTINNTNKIVHGKSGDTYFWVQTIAPLIEGTTGAPVSRYNRVLKKNQFLNYQDLGI